MIDDDSKKKELRKRRNTILLLLTVLSMFLIGGGYYLLRDGMSPQLTEFVDIMTRVPSVTAQSQISSDDIQTDWRILTTNGNESIYWNAIIINDEVILTPKFTGTIQIPQCYANYTGDPSRYCENVTYSSPNEIAVRKGKDKQDAENDIKIYKAKKDGIITIPLDKLYKYHLLGEGTITIIGDSTYSYQSINNITLEGGSAHLSLNDDTLFSRTLGYWEFSVADNSTCYDTSSRNNDGTYTDGAYKNNFGIYGGTVYLDGVNDDVNFGTKTDLRFNRTQSFTIAFWMKPMSQDASGQKQIIGYSQGTTRGWLIVQDNAISTRNVELCYYPENYGCRSSSDNVVTDNVWTHIVFTYNGTIDALFNGYRVYVDGVEDVGGGYRCGGGPGCAFTETIDYTNANFQFGQRDTAGANWNGYLDEVMIVNYTFTPSNVSQFYNKTLDRFKSQGYINFSSYDLSGGNYVNITLKNIEFNRTSNITATINNGSEAIFNVSGQIFNYNLGQIDDQSNVSILVKFYAGNGTAKYNDAWIKGNITLTHTPAELSPILSIVYPSNYSNHTSIVTRLNYTEKNAGNCSYSLDGGATNTSVQCGLNVTGLTSNQGWNTWTIFANNSYGKNASYSSTFFVDSIYPNIDFVSPTFASGVYQKGSNFSYYINSSDANFKNITARLYNSAHALAITKVNLTANISNEFTGMSDGLYYYNATACDTLNNCNNTETRNITFDNTAPTIAIMHPKNELLYVSPIISLNTSITDTNGITGNWWSINGGVTNTSWTVGENTTMTIWTTGTWNVSVWANDTAGNLASLNRIFFVAPVNSSGGGSGSGSTYNATYAAGIPYWYNYTDVITPTQPERVFKFGYDNPTIPHMLI